MKTEDIKLFHKVVEFGSLTETAKWLDLPKSNISRKIKQLEDDTGIKLFHRHSRNVTLTPSGEQFYSSTLPIIRELEQTIIKLQNPEQELTGKLKVMITPILMNIGRLVFDFMSLHPKIDVEVISSPYEQDLITNNIDVAFRICNEITQDNLIAHSIGNEVHGLYASPLYLAQHGEPSTVEEMCSHEVVAYRFSNGLAYNKLIIENGEPIQPKTKLIVNSVALLVEAAIQQKGFILISRRVGDLFVEKGLLQSVLPKYAPSHNFAWLLHPPRQYMSTEAEAFLNFILERLELLHYNDDDVINVLRVPFDPLRDNPKNK